VPYTTFFGRFEAFYDHIFTDNDKYPFGTDIDLAKEYAAYGVKAKEYYADIHPDRLTIRLGKQIVEWGELVAPIYAPGVGVMNIYDMPKVGAAGYSPRDYKVPAMSGWLSYEVTDSLSLEGVYSQDFEPENSMAVVGTYASVADLLGWGGPTTPFYVVEPEEQQYGAAARMVFPFLRNFELGAYYAHYTDWMAIMDMTDFSDMKITYEEMDMYGLSFSQAFQALQGFSLYGELSYRPEAPAPLMVVNPLDGELAPIGGFKRVRAWNWGLGGLMMLSDFFAFTPWTVTFSPLCEFYGGYNLDWNKIDLFYKPESTAYYMAVLDFASSDMVDNTTLALTFSFNGALHKEERRFYSIGTTLKARYGDNIEAMIGFDLKGGPPEKATMNTYPQWTPDRDAVTFGLTWYFM